MKMKTIPFRARSSRDNFSYKLGDYILKNEDKISTSILPSRIEARCEIKGLKLDRAMDDRLHGAFSLIKEINPRIPLPASPDDVEVKKILWVIKNKKLPFLTIGYSLEKLEKLLLFYNPKEKRLLDAIELLDSKIEFTNKSIDGRRKKYQPKPREVGKQVTYYSLDREGNAIF